MTNKLHPNFNSYMVRLRVFTVYNIKSQTLFQFLHGAIKGKKDQSILLSLPHFNSYMVRLRVRVPSLLFWRIINFNSYMVRLRAFTFGLSPGTLT